jgi:hypothetical protein
VTNTAGLHRRDPPGDAETWKYVDLVRKRLIVRFQATLFSFERPRSLEDAALPAGGAPPRMHLEICIVTVK